MTVGSTTSLERPADSGRAGEHRADIQGLRAVAVLLVVAFHAGLPLSGGYIGVDVFFVISGFVITQVLLRQHDGGHASGLGAFYTRRLRRLLPALAVMVASVCVLGAVLLSPLGAQQATADTGTATSLFSGNLQLLQVDTPGYFGTAAETNAFLHTWSLAVEEQFYLVFPTLLIGVLAARGARARRVIAWVVGVAAVLSFLDCWLTTGTGARAEAFYLPATRAWEFAAGSLLALLGSARLATVARRVPGLAIGGALLLGFAAITFDDSTRFPGSAALLPVAGAALLIVAGSRPAGSPILGARPLGWIGDVSYGWYLWHWPLIVFATAMWPLVGWVPLVAALAALVPTALSYRFVEQPVRRNDRIRGKRLLVLAGLCIAVPVLTARGLHVVGDRMAEAEDVQTYAVVTELPNQAADCAPAVIAVDCTWHADDPIGKIMVVGDSNAGQLGPPAAAAANGLGYDLVVAASVGCAFAEVERESLPGVFDRDACRGSVEKWVTEIEETRPALVMFASASAQIVMDELDLIDPRSGSVASDPATKAAMYEVGLRRVLDRLDDLGIPSVVIHQIPHFGAHAGDWQAATCPALRIYLGSCGVSIDRGQVERRQGLALTAEDQAVAGTVGSVTVDLADEICEPARCSARRGDLMLYRDATHLSIEGSLTLTERFTSIMTNRIATAG